MVSLIDSSISSHDLLQKFSVYGDVKEVILLLNFLCEIRIPNNYDNLLCLSGSRFTSLLQAAIRNL